MTDYETWAEEKRAEAGLPPDFYWPLAETVPSRT
jgi:hypothetical protein